MLVSLVLQTTGYVLSDSTMAACTVMVWLGFQVQLMWSRSQLQVMVLIKQRETHQIDCDYSQPSNFIHYRKFQPRLGWPCSHMPMTHTARQLTAYTLVMARKVLFPHTCRSLVNLQLMHFNTMVTQILLEHKDWFVKYFDRFFDILNTRHVEKEDRS